MKEKVEFKYTKRDKNKIKSLEYLWSPYLGVFENIKYLILELLFSKQIIKVMVDSASQPFSRPDMENPSDTRANADSWKGDNGMIAPIVDFLPTTKVAHWFEYQLVSLLLHKYSYHYNFITEGQASRSNAIIISDTKNNKVIRDISSIEYRVNKEQLTEMSAYMAKLEFIWLSIESLSAIATFFSTNSIELALLVTGSLELIKRLRI